MPIEQATIQPLIEARDYAVGVALILANAGLLYGLMLLALGDSGDVKPYGLSMTFGALALALGEWMAWRRWRDGPGDRIRSKKAYVIALGCLTAGAIGVGIYTYTDNQRAAEQQRQSEAWQKDLERMQKQAQPGLDAMRRLKEKQDAARKGG